MQLPQVEDVKHVSYVLIMVVFYTYFVTMFTIYLCRIIAREFLYMRQEIRAIRTWSRDQEHQAVKVQHEITK